MLMLLCYLVYIPILTIEMYTEARMCPFSLSLSLSLSL